jgi:hypothetical protein
MSSSPDQPARLGSLAQSARGKQLNQARWILIVIGVLTIGANGFMLYNTPNEVRQVVDAKVRKAQQPGMAVDPAEVKKVEQTLQFFCYLIYGGALALGVLFVVFGLIVKLYPVPVTVVSLTLYVLASLGLGLLNPQTLRPGAAIFKILIVIALAKAIQAAIAYQREKAFDADLAPESTSSIRRGAIETLPPS